jgi:hypothetical protein
VKRIAISKRYFDLSFNSAAAGGKCLTHDAHEAQRLCDPISQDFRPLAYESIEPGLKLFRPRLEPGLVYPRVWNGT